MTKRFAFATSAAFVALLLASLIQLQAPTVLECDRCGHRCQRRSWIAKAALGIFIALVVWGVVSAIFWLVGLASAPVEQ